MLVYRRVDHEIGELKKVSENISRRFPGSMCNIDLRNQTVARHDVPSKPVWKRFYGWITVICQSQELLLS